MAIVLQDQSGLAQGIGQFGQGIASGLEKRAERRLGPKDPLSKETYKTNQQLIAGVSHDSRKASALLKHADSLQEAIESGNIPGRGVVGNMWSTYYDVFNSAPKEVQLMKSLAKRSILDMGDTKGIRLTDSKLRFLEDNLWNPRKSKAENQEAYELWKEMMQDYVKYEQNLSSILGGNPNAMYSPTLSIDIAGGQYRDPGGEGGEQQQQTQGAPDRGPLPKGWKPTGANAKEFKNQKVCDPETGQCVISNGKRWVKTGG